MIALVKQDEFVLDILMFATLFDFSIDFMRVKCNTLIRYFQHHCNLRIKMDSEQKPQKPSLSACPTIQFYLILLFVVFRVVIALFWLVLYYYIIKYESSNLTEKTH